MITIIAAAQAPAPERQALGSSANAGVVERGRAASRGSTISAATSRASAQPAAIRNGASNESRSAVTPPSAGPTMEPMPVAASAFPRAWPRPPGGAESETRARAEIQLAAEPRPWTPRAAIRAPTEWVTATSTDPAATSARPATSSLRRPTASAARPRGSEKSAIGTA